MNSSVAKPTLQGLRIMFLLVTPNETSFETLDQVPKYVDEALPYFFGLILLESVVLFCQGKPLPRFNDSFTSLANGLLSILHSLLFRGTELAAFMWVYERFNIVTLPWNNPWTWVLCLLGVDLAYYWVHRFGHEINIMWAAHQTHHGSQEYNLTTALRQSMFQKYCSWLFYMPLALFLPPSLFLVHTQFNLLYQFWVHTELFYIPLALFLPPSLFLVHTQFNLLYQFWVHTELFYIPLALFLPPSLFLVHTQFNLLYQFWVHTETIKTLGPLEWILSTPSHHRVHHGRNPYCIDKNYGGIFIIWDRLFGTFEAEKTDEKPAYGLVHNLQTWNPIKSQFCHLEHIVKTAWNTKGLANKLSVVLKGPGWSPGKPRLGLHEEIPEVESPEVKYDTSVPVLKSLYIWGHYILILFVWHPYLAKNKEEFSWLFLLFNVIYIAVSLGILGSLFDNRPKSKLPFIEALRCGFFLFVSTSYMPNLPFKRTVQWIFFLSFIFWELVNMKQVWSEDKGKTMKENEVKDTGENRHKQGDTKKEQ